MNQGVLNQTLEEGNKQFPSGGGSKFFNLEEGDNKIRIISTMQVIGKHYIQGAGYKVCIGQEHNCPWCKGDINDQKVSPKYLCWVIDRTDGDKTKLAEFSYTVLKSIDDVTKIEEYHFVMGADGIFPYDLNIRMIEGKKKGEKRQYNIIPGAVKVLSAEKIKEVKALDHPMQIVENIKKKARDEEASSGGSETITIEPPKDAVPF